MRKPLVAGNWKMHGSSQFTEDLIEGLKQAASDADGVDIAVCPPFPYLALASKCLENTRIALGAQNVCDQDEGAYTAEVSGGMLAELGCRYAIVGHSERRHIYGETDALVAARFVAAKRNNLRPIFCVGETLEERESNRTEAVIDRQLQAVTAVLGESAFSDSVIAYEPVWAIGTGRNATPEQAQEVHEFIRNRVADASGPVADRLTILYGGSVKPDNAQAIFSQADVDGGLIGGASLKVDSFTAIAKAAL